MSLNLTDIAAATAERPVCGQRDYWDDSLIGFGVRVSAGGARTWQLVYRHEGRKRRLTLGSISKLNAAAARKLATRKLGEVLNGVDPAAAKTTARKMPTLAACCEEYLTEARARGTKRTIDADAAMLGTLGILPRKDGSWSPLARLTLGTMRVAAVAHDDVAALMREMAPTPYRANRARALLSVIFNRAIHSKWRDDNPVRFVSRYPEEAREACLNADELGRLVTALDASKSQRSADAVRLLILTGARRG
jgi:hypothetical protein